MALSCALVSVCDDDASLLEWLDVLLELEVGCGVLLDACVLDQLEPLFDAFAELFELLELFELPEFALLFDDAALLFDPPSAWLALFSASVKLETGLDELFDELSDEPDRTEAAVFTAARTKGSMAFSIPGYQSCEASRRMRTIFAAYSSDSRCSRRASTACSR